MTATFRRVLRDRNGWAIRSWPETWQNTLPALLAGTPAAPPFFQTDWPNPRGYLPTLQRSWTLEPLTLAPVPSVPPPTNYDQPNPRGYTYPLSLRSHASESIHLIGLDFLPFRQAEWPVPKGYTPGISLRTWTDSYKLELIGQDTFFGAPGQGPANRDWPVPKGRPYPLSLRFHSTSLVNSTLIVLPPFRQTEWPVPKGPRRGIDLLSWAQAQYFSIPVPPTPPANATILADTQFTAIRQADSGFIVYRQTDTPFIATWKGDQPLRGTK